MKTKALGAVGMVVFAWILWEKTVFTEPSKVLWNAIDGYEDRKSCHKARIEQIGNYKKLGHANLSIAPIYSFGSPKQAKFMQLLCFPQNFDPHPRK